MLLGRNLRPVGAFAGDELYLAEAVAGPFEKVVAAFGLLVVEAAAGEAGEEEHSAVGLVKYGAFAAFARLGRCVHRNCVLGQLAKAKSDSLELLRKEDRSVSRIDDRPLRAVRAAAPARQDIVARKVYVFLSGSVTQIGAEHTSIFVTPQVNGHLAKLFDPHLVPRKRRCLLRIDRGRQRK